MEIIAIVNKLLNTLKNTELTKRLIKRNPGTFFNVISQNPNLILNTTTTGTKEVLTSLLAVDQTSFIKMAVELKTSEFGNIMHCMASEKMFNVAKDLIEKIQSHYNVKIATKLMFARNFVKNSPMMVMISKMSMNDKNLYKDEKEIIISIWNICVNDKVQVNLIQRSSSQLYIQLVNRPHFGT